MNALARRSGLLGLSALALLPLAGCSLSKVAADNMGPVLRNTEIEFMKNKTPRAGLAAGPGLLAVLDGVVASSPRNPDLLELAARMDGSFAFAFLEDEDEDPAWANELYQKAQAYAQRALELRDSDLAKAVTSDLATTPKLEPIDQDCVPALFWLAFSWGSRINLNRSDERLIAGLAQVDRAMQAVLDKDETYFFGGPHLYFGVRYTGLSRSLGGNPAKGKQHFDAVDRITENRLLMSKVLRAKFYSCSLQDVPSNAKLEEMAAAQKAAWDDFFVTLKGVVEAKEDLWPEQRLANEVARQKARKLLARPEDANIIPPEGVDNPFAKKKDD